MKTKQKTLSLVIFCCSLAVASAPGQTTYTWTNAIGGNLATNSNWSPNGLPSGLPAPGDTAQWNGVAPGPLAITYGTISLPNTGGFTTGIQLVFTGNQVSPVNFTSTASAFPGSALLGLNNLSISAGAGAITIGKSGGPGPGNTFLLNIVTRPAGSGGVVHNFLNNSANTATINGDVRWLAGGGSVYVLDFDGTGNWAANNYLVSDNSGSMRVQKDGTGTMTWNPSGYLGNSGIISPAITVNAGTVVLAGSHPRLTNQAIVNNGSFEFDAPGQSQTLSGAISGTGQLQVNNGTLTLAGASIYTGNTVLSGGELIVDGFESAGISGPLGVGGAISFTGGTLGFAENNAFDYSSRFSTASGQAYRIDTGGQTVSFTNAAGLSSTGGILTKIGSGTLTLAGANTYSGDTTIGAGELVIQGTKTGSGNITVGDGAALSVYTTGVQITPATLIVGTNASATLEFENVNSTTTEPLAAGAITTGGLITVNINSGTLAAGNSYPLFSWATGSTPAVSLGNLNGFVGNLSTNGQRIQLNVTASALLWSGINNSNWDLSTLNNWKQNGASAIFTDGSPVLFGDSSSKTNVIVSAVILPSAIQVNSTKPYTITSSAANNIGGAASLMKTNTGTLTLSGGVNSYSGATIIRGGTLIVGVLIDGGMASDIGASDNGAGNLVLDGGTLQYIGGDAASDRLFTLGMFGAIDSSGTGALSLDNAGSIGYSGGGPRTLTLSGNNAGDNMLAALLANNSGATALAKSGAGKWILTANNTYSGGTTIAGGTLQVGDGSASGAIGSGSVSNNGALVFNRTGSVTVGAVSGAGSVTVQGGANVILSGDNTYSGGTTISSGTLQIGSGGATGKLDTVQPVVDNGAFIFSSSGSFTLNGSISGTGSLVVSGPGAITLDADNAYTGTNAVNGFGGLMINGTNFAASTFVNLNATLGGTGTLNGPVTFAAGTFVPGGGSSIGTLTFNSGLDLGLANVLIKVNKSLSQSNDFVAVSGTLTRNATAGGPTLTVSNLGPTLKVGDKFTVFSQPLQNGAKTSVTGAGAIWTNNLAVDGSITVTSVISPALSLIRTGNSLQFSWPGGIGNYRLQVQTNGLAPGNWSDYPGGNTSPVIVTIDASNESVFFRLVSP